MRRQKAAAPYAGVGQGVKSMFDSPPKTWRQLQGIVAQAFQEMGCETHVEEDVITVRGTTNVDVFVIDNNHVPPLVCLCECKYWSRPVPKTVVHAFRTVVADYGAHIGLIISHRGFQSGCQSVAENSNVILLSWQGFLKMYEDRWTQAVDKRLDYIDSILGTYRNNPKRAQLFPTGPDQTDQFRDAWVQCIRITDRVRANCSVRIGQLKSEDFPLRLFDLDAWDVRPDQYRTIRTKREYFDYALPRLYECQKMFEKLAGGLVE